MVRGGASKPTDAQLAMLGQILFVGRNLNFQSTADQALTKMFAGTAFRITEVYARRKTGGASVVCTGGIYDAPAKGGNALVGAAQSWVTLASGINVLAGLAALVATADLTAALLYLSLTTGSTAACTADLFVHGYAVD